MTRPALTDSQKRFRVRSMIVSLAAAVLLLTALRMVESLLPRRVLSADDILCLGAGFTYLLMGLVMTYVHVIRPQDAPMPRARVWQIMNSVCAGVAFFLPVYGESVLDPEVTFALFLALCIISSWAGWRIWREADEFMRTMLRDATVAAFPITAFVLMVYAGGERLGMLDGATAWGYLGFVSLVQIMCSFGAIFRHGANRPPADE